MEQDTPYQQQRSANLPWGYWLCSTGDAGRRDPMLLDEQGRAWKSVREALWVSRLGMAKWARSDLMHQELEFLLAVLVAIDRRIIGTEEQVLDYFGNWDKARFYGAWLHGQRLVEPSPGLDLSGSLTPEGRAILVMLASTRRHDERVIAIGLPTLRPWTGLNKGMDEETRETIIRAQEAAAQRLRFRFVTEELQKRPGIVLLGDGLGPNVPIRRKLWSISYPDVYARDRMYFWLHDRIDRWGHYGELAFRDGARALSEHLLQLRFAVEATERE